MSRSHGLQRLNIFGPWFKIERTPLPPRNPSSSQDGSLPSRNETPTTHCSKEALPSRDSEVSLSQSSRKSSTSDSPHLNSKAAAFVPRKAHSNPYPGSSNSGQNGHNGHNGTHYPGHARSMHHSYSSERTTTQHHLDNLNSLANDTTNSSSNSININHSNSAKEFSEAFSSPSSNTMTNSAQSQKDRDDHNYLHFSHFSNNSMNNTNNLQGHQEINGNSNNNFKIPENPINTALKMPEQDLFGNSNPDNRQKRNEDLSSICDTLNNKAGTGPGSLSSSSSCFAEPAMPNQMKLTNGNGFNAMASNSSLNQQPQLSSEMHIPTSLSGTNSCHSKSASTPRSSNAGSSPGESASFSYKDGMAPYNPSKYSNTKPSDSWHQERLSQNSNSLNFESSPGNGFKKPDFRPPNSNNGSNGNSAHTGTSGGTSGGTGSSGSGSGDHIRSYSDHLQRGLANPHGPGNGSDHQDLSNLSRDFTTKTVINDLTFQEQNSSFPFDPESNNQNLNMNMNNHPDNNSIQNLKTAFTSSIFTQDSHRASSRENNQIHHNQSNQSNPHSREPSLDQRSQIINNGSGWGQPTSNNGMQ